MSVMGKRRRLSPFWATLGPSTCLGGAGSAARPPGGAVGSLATPLKNTRPSGSLRLLVRTRRVACVRLAGKRVSCYIPLQPVARIRDIEGTIVSGVSPSLS